MFRTYDEHRTISKLQKLYLFCEYCFWLLSPYYSHFKNKNINNKQNYEAIQLWILRWEYVNILLYLFIIDIKILGSIFVGWVGPKQIFHKNFKSPQNFEKFLKTCGAIYWIWYFEILFVLRYPLLLL